MNPKEPVNAEVHEKLIALHFVFLRSLWENEFAISEYQNPNGAILKVEQSGKMLWK